MIRVSHFGKMGDLVYALPVMKALARMHHDKIHLVTSGLCWQLVPLLWEQPYFGEIDLDDSQPHEIVPIDRGAIFPNWEYYKGDEGINLSLQPSYFTDDAPISWTHCYMKAAGVKELTDSDCIALPSLVNHRRWLNSIDVVSNGKKAGTPKTIVLSPETDSLDEMTPRTWQNIVNSVNDHGYEPVIVGTRNRGNLAICTDLRGLTSVPTMARLIAESCGFIGAHSFPWHIARHVEVPSVCVQTWREGLRRCLPVDNKYTWIDAKNYREVVPTVLENMVGVAA
jgi:ADP-heptose:LPS heptosyltransferase